MHLVQALLYGGVTVERAGKMKYIIFPDESKVKYNFETHLLEVNCLGDFDIKDLNNVNISSNNIVMTTDSLIINSKSIFSHRNYNKYRYRK